MTTPEVHEIDVMLEPVDHDTFIDDVVAVRSMREIGADSTRSAASKRKSRDRRQERGFKRSMASGEGAQA